MGEIFSKIIQSLEILVGVKKNLNYYKPTQYT